MTNNSEEKSTSKKYQPPKDILPEHQEFVSAIGSKLKKIRVDRGLSIIDVSKALNASRNKISFIESGNIYGNVFSLLQLLTYYDIKPSDFFSELKNEL